VEPGHGRSQWRLRLGSMVGVIALAAFTPAAAGAAASAPHAAVPPKVTRGTAVKITRVGTVNLSALSKATAAGPHPRTRPGTPHAVPRLLPSSVKRNAKAALRLRALMPRAALKTSFAGNVPGEIGFNGMTTGTNEHTMGFDISPPDMGLAA